MRTFHFIRQHYNSSYTMFSETYLLYIYYTYILKYPSFYHLFIQFKMKKYTHLLSIIIAFMMIFNVYTHDGKGYGDDSCCALSTIRVIGTGNVQVDADTATIYAYITQDGTTVTDAMNKVDAILNSIQSVLKQSKLPKDDISTSYISVYPKYDYSSGTGVVVGYTVYLSLTIKIRGIDKDQTRVADVIQGLANSGVSSVSGITYDTSQSQAGKSLARKAAFADALKRGNEYAQLACEKLGRILTIDETFLSYAPYSTSGLSQLKSSSQSGSSYPVSNTELPPGKITIIINVIVTWIVRHEKI